MQATEQPMFFKIGNTFAVASVIYDAWWIICFVERDDWIEAANLTG